MEHSDNIRKRLIEHVLGQGGLREIARTLAEFVENPVAIIDMASDQMFSTINMPSPPDTDFITEYCLPGDGEASTIVQQIPLISQISGTRPRVIVPIEAVQVKTGYIIIFEQNRPLAPNDVIALEQATVVAALEIEKMEENRRAKRNFRHNLLRQILEGDSLPNSVAKLPFREVGWDLGQHYFVSAVEVVRDEQQKADKQGREIWEINEYILRNCTRLFSSKVIIGLDVRQHLIFLQPLESKSIESEQDKLTTELKAGLSKLINEINQETVMNIGCGRFYAGYEGIRTGYKEAIQALKIGTQIFGKNRITHFSELGLYRIFHNEGIKNELKLFFHEMLDPILSGKNTNNDLLETLRVFLEVGGNYRLTAKKLFLHHNTVHYRIDSIERLCKEDLKNENDRLNLSISLKLMPMFSER